MTALERRFVVALLIGVSAAIVAIVLLVAVDAMT